ncbi:MAG: hypothetical protein ACFHU9_10575 [Fluviicola sp.]
MELFFENDSVTAFRVEEGILIEEKKKGTLKMLLYILLMGIAMLIGGILLGLFGGTIGRGVGPWLVWGAIIVLGISVIALILKLVINHESKITFDKKTRELRVRGKVIPFSSISSIVHQEQSMMSKTMFFAFLIVNGKKKSLFSTAIVAQKPQQVINFIAELDAFVKEESSLTSVEKESK